jgi:hypothetical protein
MRGRIVRVTAALLYVPAMLSLVGLSMWWFDATTTDPNGNPVLMLLWFFLRLVPGLLGLTGLAMGGILIGEWSREAEVLVDRLFAKGRNA